MCFSDAQIAVISYGSESGTGVDKHLDADLDKIFDWLLPHTRKSEIWLIILRMTNEYIIN